MKPNFSLRLRVFNLNCWDIPYLSKHRADRMKRLGDFLNLESFDLALLQEVWSEQDFQYLRQKLSLTYPDAHYFRSGIIGSGLCVFSKHPIQEIIQHVYTLNGYPYMVYHGDWFCGKAVGLLVLRLNGLVLNAYVTHLHAEYSRQKDIYRAHRVTQAWELAQFIQCPHIQECRCGSVVWGPQHAPQRPGLLPAERVDRASGCLCGDSGLQGL